MLSLIGRFAAARVRGRDLWTNAYGVSRTVLAAAVGLTLAINHSAVLFPPIAGSTIVPPICEGARKAGLFCAAHDHLELARWTGVAIMAVVASGWRPRLTGWLHAWVAMSLMSSGVTLEGGDQVSAIIAFLLVPVTLTDRRKWHWQKALPAGEGTRDDLRRVVALSSIFLIRLQMSFIYLHAAVGKFFVREWQDGTALYYWANHPVFGAPPLVRALLRPFLINPVPVTLLTWGVIALEFFLSMALVMSRTHQRVVLVFGIALHLGIFVVHGLASFALCMCACLLLYLRPFDEPIRLGAFRAWFRKRRALTEMLAVSRELGPTEIHDHS